MLIAHVQAMVEGGELIAIQETGEQASDCWWELNMEQNSSTSTYNCLSSSSSLSSSSFSIRLLCLCFPDEDILLCWLRLVFSFVVVHWWVRFPSYFPFKKQLNHLTLHRGEYQTVWKPSFATARCVYKLYKQGVWVPLTQGNKRDR